MPPGRRVVSSEQVVRAGVRFFIANARLDIDELAREMSVGRATLYRVVGSRDRLFGDVLDSLSVQTLDDILRRRPGSGVDWLLEIIGEYHAAVSSFGPLRTFMRTDPELAFRILFMPEAGLHNRSIARWRLLLEQAGAVDTTAGATLPDDMAFALVRIGESMVFTEVFAGREPNLELFMRLLRALLHA